MLRDKKCRSDKDLLALGTPFAVKESETTQLRHGPADRTIQKWLKPLNKKAIP
jgi:hypothetical protein